MGWGAQFVAQDLDSNHILRLAMWLLHEDHFRNLLCKLHVFTFRHPEAMWMNDCAITTNKIPWPLQINELFSLLLPLRLFVSNFSLSLARLLVLSPWLPFCYEFTRWEFGSMTRAGSEEQLHKLNPIVLKYEHLGSEIGSAHNDSGWEWLFCLLSSEKISKSLTLTQCHRGRCVWWL